MALLACFVATGCASSFSTARRWIIGPHAADYQTAERLARESNSGMLIYFTATDLTRDDRIRERISESARHSPCANYVRCTLFRDNEPDRRYVAQFGVVRAPSLIAVHPDGTYHALSGDLSQVSMDGFLAEATPPGERPNHNPMIPRDPVYSWTADADDSLRTSAAQNRSVLFVLDRWMTRDWARLRPLLERREVHSRFADMIHCRPGTLLSSAEGVAARFGIRNLPALVIVTPDGRHHALELPSSYEAIVRFADSVRDSASTSNMSEPSAATATSSTASAE